MMKSKFEYIGGHIWSIESKDKDGYDFSIISVEIEKGKQPFIVDVVSSLLTKEILDDLLELVHKELYEK